MSEQVVPLLSRRREVAALIQKLQHVVPAAPLLMHGLERVQHEPNGWSLALGVAELTISAVVLVAFVRQVRATRQGPKAHAHGDAGDGHGVDWVDVLLGVMLGVEVWAHWHESGHIKRPTVVLAVAMVAIGLLHGRIAAWGMRRNALRIDDAGVHVGGRPFRSFRASWDQIAAVEIEPQRARIVRRDGAAREINLKDLHNAADVRAALEGVRLRLAPAADAAAAVVPAGTPDAPPA